MKDSDWLYSGYRVPWLSEDRLYIHICGFGFLNIFDELYSPESPHQKIGNLDGFERCVLEANFPRLESRWASGVQEEG